MNKDDKMDGSSSRFVWGHYKDVEWFIYYYVLMYRIYWWS
jgi:hypothetical protein